MRKVHVDLGSKSYDIEIKNTILDEVGKKLRELSKAEAAVIVTDSNVGPLYAQRLNDSLTKEGFKVSVITFPAGEESKNINVLNDIYNKMAEAGITRGDVLVALGGGVTGDMAGLAAATFLRGIDFVQVPTTLLAQIDSSVGGKVAIDLPAGKNLVGAFYQPKAVYIDPELLSTLSDRFLYDGMAETIKYGCIKDSNLFAMLEGYQDKEELLENIAEIIELCCNIKARIVEEDEFDTGLRMILNFGHTLGHAVEKKFNYTTYTHGEGVAVGMAMLTAKSEAIGIAKAGTSERLNKLLVKYKLPLVAEMKTEDFIAAIKLDKKKAGSSLTLVLIKDIGTSILQKIDFKDLENYL